MSALSVDHLVESKEKFLSLDVNDKLQLPKLIRNTKKKTCISELLPYVLKEKQHSKLDKGIEEYSLVLISAEQALTQFLEGNLSSFDSLVGENSCQIRATMISLLAKNEKGKVKKTIDRIRFVLKKMDSISHKADQKKSLYNFLKEEDLHVHVNSYELFLVCSYILTKVRVLLPPVPEKRIVRNESTVSKKIKEIAPVGSTYARDLVKKLRGLLSEASVSFIQEIAKLLPLPDSIVEMVSERYCVNHDMFGRLKCLPSFWYTLILMQYSIAMELPLVLIVNQMYTDKEYETGNEISLYFKVINGMYRLVSADKLPGDTPALVVLGSCCRKTSEFPQLEQWKEELLNYNPRDLILSYAAAHRQYPDQQKDDILKGADCNAFDFYKLRAQEWGCSLDNPSLFFLVHAYCDKIQNVAESTHIPHRGM